MLLNTDTASNKATKFSSIRHFRDTSPTWTVSWNFPDSCQIPDISQFSIQVVTVNCTLMSKAICWFVLDLHGHATSEMTNNAATWQTNVILHSLQQNNQLVVLLLCVTIAAVWFNNLLLHKHVNMKVQVWSMHSLLHEGNRYCYTVHRLNTHIQRCTRQQKAMNIIPSSAKKTATALSGTV